MSWINAVLTDKEWRRESLRDEYAGERALLVRKSQLVRHFSDICRLLAPVTFIVTGKPDLVCDTLSVFALLSDVAKSDVIILRPFSDGVRDAPGLFNRRPRASRKEQYEPAQGAGSHSAGQFLLAATSADVTAESKPQLAGFICYGTITPGEVFSAAYLPAILLAALMPSLSCSGIAHFRQYPALTTVQEKLIFKWPLKRINGRGIHRAISNVICKNQQTFSHNTTPNKIAI